MHIDVSPKYAPSFERALAHHQAGRIPEAEAIYQGVLAFDPTHADSVHLLGVAAFQRGNHDAALTLIARAIDLKPEHSVYHTNLAQVLKTTGRRDEAIAQYRHALMQDSTNLDAHNQLGVLLGECGDFGAQEEQYRAILRLAPDNVDAQFNVANLLVRRQRLDEAVATFRRVLQYRPDFAAAYNNLGSALSELSAFEDGERCYRRALHLTPEFAEAHNNLGILLSKLGRTQEAEECLRRACRLKPSFPEPFNNLGDLLRANGRPDEAESYCREALRLRSDYPSAQLNLGNALRECGHFDQAEFWYLAALRSNPHWAEANNNLSSLLFDLGRPDEAIARYRKALSERPDYVDAHANLAITLLLAGQFEEGWQEYEWRWKQDKNKPYARAFDQPPWNGEDTDDRVLLLHAEQGLGDTLQFCRFVPQIATNRRVLLEVQPPLVSLLAGMPGVERVIAAGEPLPSFDLHCPLLSLPRVLGTTLDTIPAQIPYLKADPRRVGIWRERLRPLDGLRVGLVWAGNQAMGADRRRSLTLEQFFVLSDMADVHFVSLQKGAAANQTPPRGLLLHDWTDEISDFSDTAALVEALDLIISVDTAVVHLAGALGRPVWLVNRFDRCWRWLLNRDDSPWYPTLRQFRQPYPGDWQGALRAIRTELQDLILRESIRTSRVSADTVSLEQGMTP